MTGRVRRWAWGSWAAAAAIVLLAIGLMLPLRNPYSRYATGIGEARTVALADGSTLTLDADSAVAVHFSGERRDLTLERGRASFKVAKDPLRPFAVASGHHVVVATGTAFSVERLANEMRVSLFEGRVAVLRDVPGGHAVQLARTPGASEAAEQALTPGHELIVSDDARLASLRTAVAGDVPGGGQLSFENEPLATAVERVNRYSVARRVQVSPEAAGIRVSGVFNAGDTEAFARGVAAAFPVRVTGSGNDILLTPTTSLRVPIRYRNS
jgi:transmembrane sensor